MPEGGGGGGWDVVAGGGGGGSDVVAGGGGVAAPEVPRVNVAAAAEPAFASTCVVADLD